MIGKLLIGIGTVIAGWALLDTKETKEVQNKDSFEKFEVDTQPIDKVPTTVETEAAPIKEPEVLPVDKVPTTVETEAAPIKEPEVLPVDKFGCTFDASIHRVKKDGTAYVGNNNRLHLI